MAIWDNLFKGRKKVKRKVRNYAAANSGNLFADWISGSNSADANIRFNLRKIRDRCREQARNNDYARRY